MDRLFDNEWILRGLALILAIVLWVQASLYFITLGTATIGHVRLQIVGVPAGFVASTSVRDVNVTVIAPSTLTHLLPAEFSATVTPIGTTAGVREAAVAVTVPRGTRLKTVAPDEVRLRLIRAAAGRFRRAAASKN